jgi:hypothetical protein
MSVAASSRLAAGRERMYRTLVRMVAAALIVPVSLAAQNPVEQAGAGQVLETLPNGGIIELQRAPDDSAGMRAVRTRLRAMAQAFAQGDLTGPGYSHVTSAPGARVMTDRRNAIRYDYRELPRGAALRITTGDLVARKAIWEFIAFQRNEHLADP